MSVLLGGYTAGDSSLKVFNTCEEVGNHSDMLSLNRIRLKILIVQILIIISKPH